MNDLVFAGRPQERGEHRHKGWEIICPSSPAVYGAQGRSGNDRDGHELYTIFDQCIHFFLPPFPNAAGVVNLSISGTSRLQKIIA